MRKSLALAVAIFSLFSIIVMVPKPVSSLTGWQWEDMGPMLHPAVGVAGVYNGEIYHVGLDYVQVYSPGNDTWWVKRDSLLTTDRCSGAQIGDRIYYHYGWSNFAYYNMTSNSFTFVIQPPMERIDVSLAAINDTLYVTGGWQSGQLDNPETTVEAYCPDNNTWWEVAPSIVGRYNHELVNFNGKLYMIGGELDIWNRTNVTEKYDPLTNNWSIVAPSIYSTLRGSATTVGKYIVVETGGYPESQSYIPSIDKWFEGPEPPWEHGFDHSMVTLNSDAYVMGGTTAGETPLDHFYRWDGLDSLGPSIHITSPLDNAIVNSTVNVTGTASDNFGISKVEISLDQTNWITCNGTENWYANLTLTPGINTIYALATDLVGNLDADSISVVWDIVDPEIYVSYPQNGANVSTSIFNISGTAYDEGGVDIVEYNRNSLSPTTWYLAAGTDNWTFRVNNLNPGLNTIYIRVTDRAGHQNMTSVVFTLDYDSPTVMISNPIDNFITGESVLNVSGTASDNVAVQKVEISKDNDNWTLCTGTETWSGQLMFDAGVNTCYAKATDFANNSETTNITVNVDLVNPIINITSHSDGANLTEQNISVQGTAFDNFGLESVEISLDGTNWILCEGTDSWSANITLNQGATTITVRATDLVGHTVMTGIDVDYWPPIGQTDSGINYLIMFIAIVLVTVVGFIVLKFFIWKG